MVINQWILESWIGNRGSKSIVSENTIVKEQRVNGSYIEKYSILKCTLMGFVKSYQVRIPPKQIIILKSYSTLAINLAKNENNLDPWFITGIVDAEGCFTFNLNRRTGGKKGWDVKPCFTMVLHKKDEIILKKLQSFLGVGHIYKHGQTGIQFQVNSIIELQSIIKHFDRYPLLTKKHIDFILFKDIVNIIFNKEHLTEEGILKLVSIRASLNLGLSDRLKQQFSYIKPVLRPLVESNSSSIQEQWLAGFTTGEGCFFVKITKANTKIEERVQLVFQLNQHIRDEELMRSLIQYLNCGGVTLSSASIDYRVTKLKDILTKIIPFFEKNPIIGVKYKDYLDFIQVAILMKNGQHLTQEGFEIIKKIKLNMNRGRT
jgi:LAGLIDADG endonuclease